MTGYWLKINLFYKKYWWLTPLTFFILWRLLLQFIGWVTINTIINIPNPWPADPWPPMWARWDSGWYSSIVTEGYNIQANSLSNTTFFPLYPLLWKIVWTITGWPRLIVGVVISNLAALAATLVFYRWAAIKYGLAIARKTLILWLVFQPHSF